MSRDLFQGTVPYYARYRVPYPQPLLSQVCEQAQLTGTGRLLDLGCGTGELAIRLAPRFQEVIAVDPDAEMLATAKQKARDQQVPNIQWRHHSAEKLTAEPGSCELVTSGAAFHWMDRPVMASRIKTWLQPHLERQRRLASPGSECLKTLAGRKTARRFRRIQRTRGTA